MNTNSAVVFEFILSLVFKYNLLLLIWFNLFVLYLDKKFRFKNVSVSGQNMKIINSGHQFSSYKNSIDL